MCHIVKKVVINVCARVFGIPPKRLVFLEIMTPWCIFPVNTGDKRRPLGNIARLAFKPALKC